MCVFMPNNLQNVKKNGLVSSPLSFPNQLFDSTEDHGEHGLSSFFAFVHLAYVSEQFMITDDLHLIIVAETLGNKG